MSVLKNLLLAGTFILVSAGASAEFVETDYLVTGDGLSTLHQETGLEWLDFTETAGQSYNSISAQLDTTWLGWRFPTEAEVLGMYSSFFPDINVTNPVGYSGGLTSEQFNNFLGLFGVTQASKSRTYAYYPDDNNVITFSGINSSSVHFGSYKGSSTFDSASGTVGYMLVSDGGLTLSSTNDPSLNINNASAPVNNSTASVHVPASLGLLAIAMFGFSARRKSQ